MSDDLEQLGLRAENWRLRQGLAEVNRDVHDLERALATQRAKVKGDPPYVPDRERADRPEAMCERFAERVEAIAQGLESKDRGRPGVIGWMPASVLAIEVARDLRAALEIIR